MSEPRRTEALGSPGTAVLGSLSDPHANPNVFSVPLLLPLRRRRPRRRQGPTAPGQALRPREKAPLDDLPSDRFARSARTLPAQTRLSPAEVPVARLHRPGAEHESTA